MSLVVDLHLHSYLSRATSKQLTLPNLYYWAKIKGIAVLGTGDFTHPAWFKDISAQLRPAEPGLFELKPKLAKKQDKILPPWARKKPLRFMLTTEISNIYTRAGRGRRMHNLLISPHLAAVKKLISRLSQIGNLASDGRPILGLDSQQLLQISLDTHPDNFFIPAHIWTPWFSLFGSQSGFDSIEAAFGKLSPHITALETGLSSDPFMSWRLSALNGITLVSNSDAHSPQNLGREANLIDTPLDYYQIIAAIKTGRHFAGTIEFFPQEGRYQFDGHRACGIIFSPAQSLKHHNICPQCGHPLVLGVQHRIDELANRPPNYQPKKHPKVEYIIPLASLIAESLNIKSVNSVKVQNLYHQIISHFGDEFSLLRATPIADIAAFHPQIAASISAVRRGRVDIKPGYDGVYGVISTQVSPPQMHLL